MSPTPSKAGDASGSRSARHRSWGGLQRIAWSPTQQVSGCENAVIIVKPKLEKLKQSNNASTQQEPVRLKNVPLLVERKKIQKDLSRALDNGTAARWSMLIVAT